MVVGFCETMPHQQILLKELFLCDQETLGQKIRVHYTSVMVGSVVAFFTGGLLYENYGIQGTAIFGTCVMSIKLVAVVHTLYI